MKRTTKQNLPTTTHNETKSNRNNNTNRNAKYNTIALYRLALLGGALLGLSALNAQGQTVIRRTATSRQITFASGQTLTIYSPATPNYTYSNYAYSNYAYPNYAYQNYGPNRSVGAVGTTNLVNSTNRAFGTAVMAAPQTPSGPPPQTQASDTITAQYAGSSQLQVQWSGNSNTVRQVKLAVFDADLNMLGSQTLTQTPVVALFPMTSDIAYYGAQIIYTNGKVTTTYQPLQ